MKKLILRWFVLFMLLWIFTKASFSNAIIYAFITISSVLLFIKLIAFIKDRSQKNKKLLNKLHVEAERAKMTDKLRYEIIKKDNFKCVYCGRSQKKDGVILHVDHIKPVSKGGKTERSNLQTLCERCNMGKRADYDPDVHKPRTFW